MKKILDAVSNNLIMFEYRGRAATKTEGLRGCWPYLSGLLKTRDWEENGDRLRCRVTSTGVSRCCNLEPTKKNQSQLEGHAI